MVCFVLHGKFQPHFFLSLHARVYTISGFRACANCRHSGIWRQARRQLESGIAGHAMGRASVLRFLSETVRTISTSTRTSTAGADSSRRIGSRAAQSHGSSPSWPTGGTSSAGGRSETGTWNRQRLVQCTWAS